MDVMERESQRGLGNKPPIVNDFSIVAATANGTGSQTANLTLLRSFFKMGIPVHGKNIFPSNIQGLPTWYHLRVSQKGYVARRQSEILIAFNPASLEEDIRELPAGGVCLYNEAIKLSAFREDISYYGLAVNDLIKDADVPVQRKPYIANMVYVGALAQLLGIPLNIVEDALASQFSYRKKLVDSNMAVVTKAFTWAEAQLEKNDPYQVQPLDKTEGLILMTGNEAGALGAVFGGVSLSAWYPITPSTSFIDALRSFLPKLRQDNHASFAVIQAEDELAAIGMTIGAGWAGARAVTATSGPGISLMSEFAGLAYFAEIPTVIWDIQRVGPSTGLPTRTGQCDVTFVYYLGHGDSKNIVLFPSSIEECFNYGYQAFDLADQLQTPIYVLSDLDLGMNNWMGKPFDYPQEPMQRGKVLSATDLKELEGFSRYLDVDGDGIPYRTLPGNEDPKSAWFARGTGHNEHAVYSERADDWLKNMDRLTRKFETARGLVPKPILSKAASPTKIGIIAYGTSRYAIEEARDELAGKLACNFLRLCALPIGPEVRAFVEEHDRVYVIELNRDGQLYGILQTELPDLSRKLRSIAHLDGMPFTAIWVQDRLLKEEGL